MAGWLLLLRAEELLAVAAAEQEDEPLQVAAQFIQAASGAADELCQRGAADPHAAQIVFDALAQLAGIVAGFNTNRTMCSPTDWQFVLMRAPRPSMAPGTLGLAGPDVNTRVNGIRSLARNR